MDQPFPTHPREVDAWAVQNASPLAEAQRRYAHYLALNCLAAEPSLSRQLALRGGAVASYVYGAPRTPEDLDLSLISRQDDSIPPSQRRVLIQRISAAFDRQMPKFCAELDHWAARLHQLIKVELNGVTEPFRLTTFSLNPLSPSAAIQVTDLSSTVGAKYLSLVRNDKVGQRRGAHKDVFDLAWLIRLHGAQVNPAAMFDCLAGRKDARRGMGTAAELFNADIRAAARAAYQQLKPNSAARFIEFDEAWNILVTHWNQAHCQVFRTND